jgi:hypothetical protein
MTRHHTPSGHPPSERSENRLPLGADATSAGLRPLPAHPAWFGCPSCDGFGDYGLDDEGRALVCYTCYGDGRISAERREESDE